MSVYSAKILSAPCSITFWSLAWRRQTEIKSQKVTIAGVTSRLTQSYKLSVRENVFYCIFDPKGLILMFLMSFFFLLLWFWSPWHILWLTRGAERDFEAITFFSSSHFSQFQQYWSANLQVLWESRQFLVFFIIRVFVVTRQYSLCLKAQKYMLWCLRNVSLKWNIS